MKFTNSTQDDNQSLIIPNSQPEVGKRPLKFLILNLIKEKMHEDESKEDGNDSEVRQSFRDFLVLITKNSDVKIATAENQLPSSRSFCLPSENKSVAQVGLSISLSPAIVDLVKSWFEDF